MADGFRVEMSGWAELQAELKALPDRLQKQVVTGAMGTAAHTIKRAIIDKAPIYTGKVSQGHPPPGTLKNAIYAVRLADECTRTREVWLIGVRSGKKFRHTGKTSSSRGPTQGVNRDAFYARWVEYGHYSRPPSDLGPSKAARRKVVHEAQRLVKGAHWVMAKPFFRPGFHASAGPAMAAAAEYMRTKISLATSVMKIIKARR